jgi:hypothetical protein
MSMSAVMSFLANGRNPAAVLNKGAEATASELREGWILEPKTLDPDSVEAAEAAEVEARNLAGARRRWAKLAPEQRTTLLATARTVGVNPTEVRSCLD